MEPFWAPGRFHGAPGHTLEQPSHEQGAILVPILAGLMGPREHILEQLSRGHEAILVHIIWIQDVNAVHIIFQILSPKN